MRVNIRKPIPWTKLQMKEVDEHRLDLCVFYDVCLYEVAIKKWDGFTCTYCRVYEEEWGKSPKIASEAEAREFLTRLRATGLKF